jgi:rubrerythrin
MKGMTRKFQRTIENFTCGHCGTEVTGDGYTNHCPLCLYSRHVDINPGDRAATCGGLMAPRSIEQKRGAFVIVHVCMTCGHMRKNKVSQQDSIDEIIRISGSIER